MTKKNLKIIQAFTGALSEFDSILSQVPPEGLTWAESEGEWTIRQIIHHLAGDCDVYSFIIKRALVSPGCQQIFGEFPGNDTWANQLAFQERPVEPALALMHAHRAYLAELVGHFPDRFNHPITFHNQAGEKIGESTVEKMIVMLTEHMQTHTESIRRILAGSA